MNNLHAELDKIALRLFLLEFQHQQLTNEERAIVVAAMQAKALAEIADALHQRSAN